MRRAFALLLLGSVSASAHGAFGQTSASTAPAARPAELEQIVVEARRSEENQQTVPVAISTVTEQKIQDDTISYVGDIQRLVPSLQIQQGVTGQTDFLIRGSFSGFGNDPAVVTYIDEVPIDSRALEYGVFDLSSVQELKGPQGTLFGRNSTGGAVLFVSQKPNLSNFGGYVDARYGNYNEERLEGALNVPVSSTLALRLSAEEELRDGVVDSVTDPSRHYGNRDNHVIRLSALWKPSDVFDNYLQLTDYHVMENRMPRVAVSLSCPSLACIVDPTFPAYNQQQFALPSNKTVNNFSDYDHVDRESVTDTATAHLGSINIRNTAYYGFDKLLFTNDYDGTPAKVVDAVELTKDITYYDEVQIFGVAADDRLNWRVGGVASRDRGALANENIIFPALFPTGAPNYVSDTTMFDSKALFGEATYDFGGLSPYLHGVSLTAGYRYTWDSRDIAIANWGGASVPLLCEFQTFNQVGGALVPSGIPFPNTDLATCTRRLSLNSSNSNYNLTLSYAPTDHFLVYAAARKGYKAGSFNTLTPPGPEAVSLATYAPEVVHDVEVGVKSDWKVAQTPVRLNVAAFSSKYDNIQVTQTYIGSTVAILVENTDPSGRPNKATIQGFEAELTALPTSWLEVSGFYSRVWARFDQFTNQSGVNLSGQNVDGVVPTTYGVNATLTFPIAGPYQDLRLFGSYYAAAAPLTNASTVTLSPGTYSLDLRLEARNVFQSGADLALWGKNLTDRRSCGLDPLVTGQVTEQCNDPRTFGVELRYRFGS